MILNHFSMHSSTFSHIIYTTVIGDSHQSTVYCFRLHTGSRTDGLHSTRLRRNNHEERRQATRVQAVQLLELRDQRKYGRKRVDTFLVRRQIELRQLSYFNTYYGAHGWSIIIIAFKWRLAYAKPNDSTIGNTAWFGEKRTNGWQYQLK